jgi:hypothetical protein
MLLQFRRTQRRALMVATLCATAVALVPATAQASGGNLSLPNVMTRNIYLGADLTPAIAAVGCTPQPGCTLAANQIVWNQVVATNFPARAKLLAREIDDDDPWVVGLQEVALWRSGPVNGVKDAATDEYDFLQILLSEISARGLKYKVQVVQQEADVESPAGTSLADAKDRRLTMRDVILVRTDLPKVLISFSNPQSSNYAPTRTAEIGIGTSTYGDPCAYTPPPSGPNCIVFKRGWTATDVKILGKPVAIFVNTHLESAASGIRQLQAAELVGAFGTGPLLNPNRAAILVGDFNSDPVIPYGGNPASGVSDGVAYGIIAGAGFVDSGNTENTFGHNSNVNDFPSNPMTERIDHILTRPGAFGLLDTKVVGDGSAPVYRTSGGLWPSDHAGVIAGIG